MSLELQQQQQQQNIMNLTFELQSKSDHSAYRLVSDVLPLLYVCRIF